MKKKQKELGVACVESPEGGGEQERADIQEARRQHGAFVAALKEGTRQVVRKERERLGVADPEIIGHWQCRVCHKKHKKRGEANSCCSTAEYIYECQECLAQMAKSQIDEHICPTNSPLPPHRYEEHRDQRRRTTQAFLTLTT